jgi:hypothetical protein
MCRIVWRSQYEQRDRAARCFCGAGKYERWRDVRFRIERHEKMVVIDLAGFAAACTSRKRYPIAADACVVGILESQLKQRRPFVLADDTLMADLPPDEHIVLLRVPNGRSPSGSKRLNMYIPPLFLKRYRDAAAEARKLEITALINATTDESKKLEYVQIQQHLHVHGTEQPGLHSAVDRVRMAGRTFRRSHEHPSSAWVKDRYAGYIGERGRLVSWSSEPAEVPPPNYVCHRCMGHFPEPHLTAQCPSHKIKGWISMRDRRRPTGIPVSERVRVPDDAPIQMVASARFRDLNGVLWVKKQPGVLKRKRSPSPQPPPTPPPPPPPPPPPTTNDFIADLWAEPNAEAEYLYI